MYGPRTPFPTRKTTTSGAAFRALAAVAVMVAVTALTPALTGCTRVETTAPSSVRATDVKARFGTVDCREASGAQS